MEHFRHARCARHARPARGAEQRLYTLKEQVWAQFGHSCAYLERMQSQSFWDGEFERIPEIDRKLTLQRN